MPGPFSAAARAPRSLRAPGTISPVVASNGQITLSLDGAPYASVAASLPALNTISLIGGDAASSSASPVAPATTPVRNRAVLSPRCAGCGRLARHPRLMLR